MTSRPALRRCVAGDLDLFARDVWAAGPLLSTAAELAAAAREGAGGPAYCFEDLFSLAAVDELLSRRGLRTPFIRLAKGGAVVPASRYTRPGGTGAQVGDQVADERVLELFLDGHTIVLQGLHRTWSPMTEYAGALAHELGHPVQVNAYVTPAASQGFSAHYDVHDVFVLQVAGEKRWRIHEAVHPAPNRDQPWTDHRAAVAARAAEEPVIDAVLRPGDALYLPRGFLHAAEALGGVTCHLTVGVHPVTRSHVLQTLLAIVADDPALRASLPLGLDLSDPTAFEADLAATVAALTARLGSVSPAEVVAALAVGQLGSTRPAPISPLVQASAWELLDADSVIRVRARLEHVVTVGATDPDDSRPAAPAALTLRLPDRALSFEPVAIAAVLALLEGGTHRVGDLPGLDPEGALALARRLVRDAVAVVE